MSLKKAYLIFIVCWHMGFAFSQKADEFTFRHYTAASGLISNQVFSTVQDEQGYLWIGGIEGLQRFDGIRFLTFRHKDNDPSTIPSNPVLQLIMDEQQRLWVLLLDGTVGIFDTKKFKFSEKLVRLKDPLAKNASLKRLIKDEFGNIFYLMEGIELVTWSEKQQQFSFANNFFSLPVGKKITGFTQQPNTSKYWIGLHGGGMAIYNATTKTLSYTGNNTDKEPFLDIANPKMFAAQMLFDKNGRMWFYWWENVFPYIICFDSKKKEIKKYELLSQIKVYHEVYDLFEQDDGTIWVRGANVFARFIEKDNQFSLVQNGFYNEHSIYYEAVTSLYQDDKSNIWVGTGNNGLYSFNPAQNYFSNITHENRRLQRKGIGSPMSFAQTKWGTILVGTWEDGLYQYDQDLKPIDINFKGFGNGESPFVWGMASSADSNTIWMACQPGLYALNQDQRAVRFYNPAVLKNKTIRQVAEDQKGNLWLGMQHIGLFKWTVPKSKNLAASAPKKISFIPDDVINKIIVSKDGLVWVATATNGLYVLNPNTESLLMHFAKDAKDPLALPEDEVSSVLEYDDHLVVISLRNNVMVYNQVTHHISRKFGPGAFSGYMASLEKDAEGYVWLSTTNGLYRLSLNNKILLQFTAEDGIHNQNFVMGGSARLSDGRMLFANSNQFIAFTPSAIKINATTPDFKITGFDLMNKSLRVDSLLRQEVINLAYNQNSLTIYFSPMTIDKNYVVRYKLDGLDKDWVMADERHQASYSYLPTGTYTLQMGAINGEGNFTISDISLVIKINTPFWKSWWFYSILVLLAGGLLFWLDKERTKRKESVEAMRNNIAGNLHHEVNTALNNINILSEMARQKTDTEPEKSKQFIEQIHSKSHNMIIAMDDMLWSISPENDSMEKTVDRMQEYIDALNNRHAANIDMLLDKKIKSLKLDMQLRYEAFWLFKESIFSLVKAGVRQAKIHVTLEKNNLLYTIQFNNETSDMQQLNNLFQRQDMMLRLQNIKAKRNIQLHRSNSLMEIRIPLLRH